MLWKANKLIVTSLTFRFIRTRSVSCQLAAHRGEVGCSLLSLPGSCSNVSTELPTLPYHHFWVHVSTPILCRVQPYYCHHAATPSVSRSSIVDPLMQSSLLGRECIGLTMMNMVPCSARAKFECNEKSYEQCSA